jgi:hypothetical protein
MYEFIFNFVWWIAITLCKRLMLSRLNLYCTKACVTAGLFSVCLLCCVFVHNSAWRVDLKHINLEHTVRVRLRCDELKQIITHIRIRSMLCDLSQMNATIVIVVSVNHITIIKCESHTSCVCDLSHMNAAIVIVVSVNHITLIKCESHNVWHKTIVEMVHIRELLSNG